VFSGAADDVDIPVGLLRRFTVAEYHAMIDAGVFTEDENFELLEGFIVQKMPKHPPHWISMELLRQALSSLNIPGFFLHIQNPVTTTDSEPEPDLALVRGHPRDYVGGNPEPKQTPLVIEVADSSLDKDRRWKKRIYARAGVPVYWIVNLIDRQIEVYTQPSGPTERPDYAGAEIFGPEATVPVIIDDREAGRIAVKDVLP
jgi:Uma2 family endonuclease